MNFVNGCILTIIRLTFPKISLVMIDYLKCDHSSSALMFDFKLFPCFEGCAWMSKYFQQKCDICQLNHINGEQNFSLYAIRYLFRRWKYVILENTPNFGAASNAVVRLPQSEVKSLLVQLSVLASLLFYGATREQCVWYLLMLVFNNSCLEIQIFICKQ